MSRRRPPAPLGELEAAIMQVVWARGEASVHDVVRALAPGRDLAYTTVMTVLSRLARKRLLKRRREGRAFVYSPAVPRDSTMRGMLGRLTKQLYGTASVEAIAHLIEDEPEIDDRELDRLEALIEARRRRRR